LDIKKIIRSFANASISIILVLGLLISWDFFNEEYKDGYFALAFSIATIQGIVLYILVSISDIILRNQYEIKKN
jgi:TRAP-type C4-dicarboxylate transport system permease small subunit